MRIEPLPRNGLHLFEPPYESLLPYEPIDVAEPRPGAALVWVLAAESDLGAEVNAIRGRRWSLPLFVVLPEPEHIVAVASVLRVIPDLRPRDVLPAAGDMLLPALRSLLASPPAALPPAVGEQLRWAGVVDEEERERVETIFAAAPRVHSIERLAGVLCQSRRTLGRYFRDRSLPVPSHWLQFARVLHVAIQIQNTRTNINRISGRFGYPDGFTMSNSMNRLTGYRPTFVRKHLGWEWLLDAWLRREGLN